MTCEWCGHDHARDALCTSRPKWSRRGFLSLFGAGIAGLAVAPSLAIERACPTFEPMWAARVPVSTSSFDEILKAYYEPVIQAQFENSNGLWQIVAGPKKGKTFRVDAR